MEQTVIGKIMKGVGGLYTVRLLTPCHLPAGEQVLCRARGSFRHEGLTPLPGDTVTVLFSDSAEQQKTKSSPKGEQTGAVIDSIHDRTCALIRPPLANLDVLFVTVAAASPTPILTTTDKLISIAEFNGIEPVVIITKGELNPSYAEELRQIYETCGFTCFVTSSEHGMGIDALHDYINKTLSGKIAAFAGASGIGKSTLMNRLFPDLRLSTSEISRKIERGRHTTRHVELFCLSDDVDCGYIADTPGFSMLDFDRFDFFDKEDLPTTFREFVPHIGNCRYTKCSHTKEDGCAILEAVKGGKIPRTRHESFCELYETLKAKKKWN